MDVSPPPSPEFHSTHSSSMPVMSGWLRKRPHYGTGHWAARFFVLSQDDATMRAFGNETESALSSHKAARKRMSRRAGEEERLVTPTHAFTLTNDLVVSGPFEKHVRVERAGTKRERVYCLLLSKEHAGKTQAFFTLGAPTPEEAAKWKASLEEIASCHGRQRGSSRAEAPSLGEAYRSSPVRSSSNSNLTQAASADASTPGSSFASHLGGSQSMWNDDAKWQLVDMKDGVEFEGEREFTRKFPSLRAKANVEGSPKQVFDLILDDNRRKLWDDHVEEHRVLREVSKSAHIVYVQMRSFWIGPVQTGARDLVLLRYFRQDADGSYEVTWQSVEDADLSPPREGFTRGKIFAMGFSIMPIANEPNKCVIRFTCHADPGGALSLMPSSMLQRWLFLFATRVVGIKKALGTGSLASIVSTPGMSGDDTSFEPPISTPPTPYLGPKSSSQKQLDEATTEHKFGSFDHAEWSETPSTEPFTIRGKTYLEDNIKYKTGTHMFNVVASDLYRLDKPLPHCAARSDSPIHAIREAYPGRQIFVLQFMLPGPPFFSFAMYAVAKKGVLEGDTPFANLWNDFVEGTDEYRNSVFKLIPRVPSGPYLVRRTVGETPALLGKKMKMVYYHAKDYFEVDCDLGSSAVAGSILSIVRSSATALTVDLAVLLEGHSERELPEQILCAWRTIKPHMNRAKVLPEDPHPEKTAAARDVVENRRDVDAGEDSD